MKKVHLMSWLILFFSLFPSVLQAQSYNELWKEVEAAQKKDLPKTVIGVVDKIGRKKLIYYGVSGMIISLIAIGIYFLAGEKVGLSNTYLLLFFLAYIFFCAGSISAVIFVLLSEMYPTKIRGLAMSVAGLSLWIGTYLIGQLTPWMLETLTPGGTFFLFAFMCLPYMLIVWKLMPETAGKTLEEIELFWTGQKCKS